MGANGIMAKLVEDPELIKALNSAGGYDDDSSALSNESSGSNQPSTQLQQNSPLNSLKNLGNYLFNDKSEPDLGSELKSLAPNTYNFAAGMGGGIQNFGHDILPSIVPKFNPRGFAQEVGDPLGNALSYIVGAEPAIAKGATYLGAKGLPILENLGKNALSTLSGRLGSSALYGAITEPEDRLKGAKTGLTLGALGETIPAGAKILGETAEFLHPQRFTNDLASSIRNNYLNTKQEASKLYAPVTNTLGKSPITNYPNYSEYRKLGNDIFKEYPTKLKDVHDEFIKKPNLENAHELQSRIGKTLNTYVSKNEPQAAIEKLSKAKDYLQNDINRFLELKNPVLSQQYKQAGQFYKENVLPYKSEKNIAAISSSKGKLPTIKPKQLQNSLNKVSQVGLPENHMLSKSLEDLTNRIDRGKATTTAGSLAAGSFIPGVGPVLGGVAGKFVMPQLLELATNPWVTKTVSGARSPYDALVKSIINTQTGNR